NVHCRLRRNAVVDRRRGDTWIGLEDRIDSGYDEGNEIHVVWRNGATGQSVTVARHQAPYRVSGGI
ncbi:MAG: hypothetical protein ACLFNI_08110, partial [Natronomonas sp.]